MAQPIPVRSSTAVIVPEVLWQWIVEFRLQIRLGIYYGRISSAYLWPAAEDLEAIRWSYAAPLVTAVSALVGGSAEAANAAVRIGGSVWLAWQTLMQEPATKPMAQRRAEILAAVPSNVPIINALGSGGWNYKDPSTAR